MTEEVYVIQTKGDFKKFPYDKRNKFPKKDDLTFDIFESYMYLEEQLALEDMADLGFNKDKFEVKKYIVAYEEVK